MIAGLNRRRTLLPGAALVVIVAGIVAVVIVARDTHEPGPGIDEFPPLVVQRAAEPEVDTGFEDGPPNREPRGFVPYVSGGEKGTWTVQPDPAAVANGQVVAQTSTDASADRYPCLLYVNSVQNSDISARFKTTTGTVDQAAGIVLGWRNPDDYSVVQASALEKTVRFDSVVDGKRTTIAKARLAVEPDMWHALRVVVKNFRLDAYLDGKRVLAAENQLSFVGEYGFSTRADSVTYFDDLEVWRLE